MSGGVDFGGLDLTGEVDYDGVTFEAMGDGATLGNPQPVERSITSSLLDGSFVVTDSHNNREASFQVWIKAADSAALAYGEKLLFEQCSRRVEFGWTPPDGWGARTVYEAFTSSLEHEFDDLLEMTQLVRSYRLRIVCAPFGFSEDEVVDVAVDASPVTPTTVIISDGSSATGWTSPDGAVTSSSGRLVTATHDGPGTYLPGQGADYRDHAGWIVTTFTATNFAATQYVTAELKLTNCYAIAGYAFADGNALAEVSRTTLGEGYVRTTWRCLDSSVTTLQVGAIGTSGVAPGAPAPTVQLQVDNISRSNVGPTPTVTGKESLRTIAVTGSARTAASLTVEHETLGLGDVLFYTSAALGNGYSPNLRPWLTGAPVVTPDVDNTVSGVYSVSSSQTFEVPASVLPDGPHLIFLRARSDTVGNNDATITARTLVGGTTYGETVLPVVESLPGSADPFEIRTVGVLTLPGVKVPQQSDTLIQFEVEGQIQLDEVWTFYLGEDSDLTYVAAGSGTPVLGSVHNRLFLESPSISNGGTPGLYVGTEASGSDAFHPGYPIVQAWGRHPFVPPSMAMFVVTTGAGNPTVTLRHRPAWFTHAGQ